jgi:hypothetical protein
MPCLWVVKRGTVLNYKPIHVKGRAYKFHVGRRFIEVRNDDDGKPYKLLIPRPEKQQRWGVICPCLDGGRDYIDIYLDEEKAQEAMDKLQGNWPGVEFVSLPAKTIPITPSWVKNELISLDPSCVS